MSRRRTELFIHRGFKSVNGTGETFCKFTGNTEFVQGYTIRLPFLKMTDWVKRGVHMKTIWVGGRFRIPRSMPLQPNRAGCPMQRHPHTAPGDMTATSDQNSVTPGTAFSTPRRPSSVSCRCVTAGVNGFQFLGLIPNLIHFSTGSLLQALFPFGEYPFHILEAGHEF